MDRCIKLRRDSNGSVKAAEESEQADERIILNICAKLWVLREFGGLGGNIDPHLIEPSGRNFNIGGNPI